ncbi:aldehyde dehydrogenase family protein, partial [Pseudomonadota bacterium]
ADAHRQISDYCAGMAEAGRLLKRLEPPKSGLFVPPTALKVEGIGEIGEEIFGPVLHVARFEGNRIDEVVREINAKGYGLTFGLHTRIDSRVQQILDEIRAGNIYVNRDQIGAVVGSQPFGGEGLSGTGPKAGGAHYAPRFRRRIAPSTMDIASGPEIGAKALHDALTSLDGTNWAASVDRIKALRAALRGSAAEAVSAAASLDCGPIDLPGPTGESNQFFLFPRGVGLCLGPDRESLLAQVVQGLAAGNAVLAVAPDASQHLHALKNGGFPLTVCDGILEDGALRDLPVDVVACCSGPGQIAKLRIACADREGPIITLITEPIAPAAYCTERTICIDTTAAGGNATLLSTAEG